MKEKMLFAIVNHDGVQQNIFYVPQLNKYA